jgi:hypothetical protein
VPRSGSAMTASPEQVGECQTRPKLPGVGIDGVAAERVVLAARPLHEGERDAVADREDAEESAWFEPGVHARDRGTAPVCVVGEGYRRVVMVNPRPGQLGNPGVTAVCADHQARAALSPEVVTPVTRSPVPMGSGSIRTSQVRAVQPQDR